MTFSVNLREAAIDLRFLLNRGYNRKSSIEFVGDKWNLNREERHILYRAIFSAEEIKARQWNEVSIDEITGKIIAIDTYNVLITIESLLKGLLLIISDDLYIRDISKIFNKYRQSIHTLRAIQLILSKLKPFQPKRLLFFLDKNISHSGDLASLINAQLKKYQIEGTAQTVLFADKSVITNGEIVISNDRVILDRALAHLNLIPLIIKEIEISKVKIIKIE
ncbi:MAG: DUF434 domain-containing protein [Candidatus Helarchaeota archaeon]